MIVRHLDEIIGTDREVSADTWTSRRLVLARDQVDFSFHDTVIKAGTETLIRYRHHYESVYCIEGEGVVTREADGSTFEVKPGTIYVVDRNDPHVLRATTDMRLMCVFSPPLTGREVIDEQGDYPLLASRKSLRVKNIFVVGLNDFNRKELSSIRNSDNYNYLPLLSPDDVLEQTEYPIDELLHKAHQQIVDLNDRVDGLIHYIDFPVSTMVPILARDLGLPAASLEAVLKCEHKYWSRIEQAKASPENVPEFRAFDPFDDDALDKLKLSFPFWVKPIKSFSSYLGFRVDHEKDWERAISEIRPNIGRFGSFDDLLDRVELPSEIQGIGANMCIAEKIIGGRQCTQEGFVHKGEVKVYGTVDSHREGNLSCFSSYQYPSRLPIGVRKRMTRITTKVLEQIGYDNAPFNIEYFWDANVDRLWLLEINPRISESHTDLFLKVDGASHHEIAVDLSLGQRPRLPYRDGEFACAGKFFLRRFSDGLVKRVPDARDIEKLRDAIPGTVVKIIPRIGQRLSELMDQDSYSYTLAIMWIGGSSPKQLQKKFEKAVDLLPFEFASA